MLIRHRRVPQIFFCIGIGEIILGREKGFQRYGFASWPRSMRRDMTLKIGRAVGHRNVPLAAAHL